MPIVRFLPTGKSITTSANTPLLEAAGQAGVNIEAPCGAKGTCGKCVVKVIKGSVDQVDHSILSLEAIREGYVQACKTKIGHEDVTLEIPDVKISQGQFADSGLDFQRVPADRFPQEWEMHPMVSSIKLFIPQSTQESALSDHDRLNQSLQEVFSNQQVECPLPVLQVLSKRMREESGNISLVLEHQADSLKILKVKAGHQFFDLFGLAIDLGTTSISVRLDSLSNKKNAVTKSGYNQQLTCGADIISRINFAGQKNRLEELRQKALESINSLVREIVTEKEITADHIFSVVISGNTTMIHLLLGIPPEYIRLEPYTPAAMTFPGFIAREIGIEVHPLALTHISPAVGSYVGGDIMAGLLCTDLVDKDDGISMFLDIGTNGELAIGNRDFIMACACSAGPAFEGGGIASGMRAARGAIEAVSIDPQSGKAKVKTIQEAKPKGICGSGIISLLAELFGTGWLDPSGKLERSRSSSVIEVEGRHARYIIVPANESGTGKAISISEAEIENVIRAKAAIYSAYRLLMNQVGIDFDEIDIFFIAGGFGNFLDLENSVTIGLLPDIPRSRFRFLGNTSLTGSTMLLHSREFQSKQQELADRVTYIDLSSDPGYMEQYTAALFLPHTDSSLFPSVT